MKQVISNPKHDQTYFYTDSLPNRHEKCTLWKKYSKKHDGIFRINKKGVYSFYQPHK